MNESPPPRWKLPDGVNASLWQYAHTPRLAEDEEAYFADHPLFAADTLALDQRFKAASPLIDLGCGTGRLSLHFAQKGFPVVAVDLAPAMLARVAQHARTERLPVTTVRANLCRLGCFPDRHFAYGLAMFSTFGMIRGARSRQRALSEAFRILRPGGRLALHAHNLWLNLFDSQGRRWLMGQFWRAFRGQTGLGDRTMTYRGVPGMEVHLYRWSELSHSLRQAGFQVDEVLALDAVTAEPIAAPWLLPSCRAGGWLVFASRPGGIERPGRAWEAK